MMKFSFVLTSIFKSISSGEVVTWIVCGFSCVHITLNREEEVELIKCTLNTFAWVR